MLMESIAVFCAFGEVLAVCEFAGRISCAFDDISDRVEQLDWYRFPRELRQMLPLTITFTQQTIDFPCFGSTLCDREAFKKACIDTRILAIIVNSKINPYKLFFSGCQDRIFILYDTTPVLTSCESALTGWKYMELDGTD